ncbi:MAG: hypothetical protein ACI8TP_004736 [Acidimicrobiales bacterium]|jgi:hypothetical protein
MSRSGSLSGDHLGATGWGSGPAKIVAMPGSVCRRSISRRSRLPLVFALVALLGACNSVSTDDAEPTDSTAASDSETASAFGSAETVTCGPVQLGLTDVEGAEGRLSDAAGEAFATVGVLVGAPERWSVVPADDEVTVIVDREPLDADSSAYWIRIAQPAIGSSFDGVCVFGVADQSSSTGRAPEAPGECSVVADSFAITTLWSGADQEGGVAVLRDGVDLIVSPVAAASAGLTDVLADRRVEHGESAVPDVSQSDPSDGLDGGSGGHADRTAAAGTSHTYEVQGVGPGGARSDAITCGAAELAAAVGEVACSVSADDFGWPVVRWESVESIQVIVLRDGVALESDAVDFASPHVDRTVPNGAEVQYSIRISGGAQIPCGSATVATEPTGSADLQQIATDNVESYSGPFEYVTVSPICDGCDAAPVEIYLVPDLVDIARHEVEIAWIDGSPTSETGPWLIDPLFVAHELLEAEAAGSEVTYAIDAETGLITRWTIDGRGAELLCFEIDTRPIEMRTDRCGRSNVLN